MKTFTYLSMIPEALILSQLPPEDFGNYLAVGTRKRARGQAIFFEVDPEFRSDAFKIDQARARCTQHGDGGPKNSAYVSVYKVLENVPLRVIGDLYLTTSDGRVLRIEAAPFPQEEEALPLRLYQELCPLQTMVSSKLDPRAFGQWLTAPDQPVGMPRLVFCDLNLGGLARDPQNGDASNLPYPQIDHLRDCLAGLANEPGKRTKTVIRGMPQGILYRTVGSGFFVVDATGLLFYPMPSRHELETDHYYWWHAARMAVTA
jgi:hypothetical protein